MKVLALLTAISFSCAGMAQDTVAEARTLDITCFDLQNDSALWLPPVFRTEVFDVERPKAEAAGFSTFYQGQRCFDTQSAPGKVYGVVVFTKGGFLKRDVVPFSWAGARIVLSGQPSAVDSVEGIVIAGPSANLSNANGSIIGSIMTDRFQPDEDVIVVVRRLTNSRQQHVEAEAAKAKSIRRAGLTQEQLIREDDLADRSDLIRLEELRINKKEFRQWEKENPLKAKLCQGDQNCMN